MIRDADPSDQSRKRGIAIDDAFHPVSDEPATERIFCLSLPFILGRHPFHQGITSSYAAGRKVANELVALLGRDPQDEASCSQAGDRI